MGTPRLIAHTLHLVHNSSCHRISNGNEYSNSHPQKIDKVFFSITHDTLKSPFPNMVLKIENQAIFHGALTMQHSDRTETANYNFPRMHISL